MNVQHWFTLESMHHRTGLLLKYGQRLLCAAMVMGAGFCVFSFLVAQLLQQPEAYLHTQGFMFNYAEIAHGESAPAILANGHTGQKNQKDPNWDGALAGASLGFTLGQNIPFIGAACGPVLGGILGYELDSRI